MTAIRKAKITTTIANRALIARINRLLRHQGQMGRILKASRGARALSDLGQYFVLDIERNIIVLHHVDPENLGRELGVLAQWEHVEG